jgi:hypothetical protein
VALPSLRVSARVTFENPRGNSGPICEVRLGMIAAEGVDATLVPTPLVAVTENV